MVRPVTVYHHSVHEEMCSLKKTNPKERNFISEGESLRLVVMGGES